MKLFSPDSAHWYQRDGTPLHTVLSAKGEPRPTTLRDARKLDLLPSVTNVLNVIAKPELTAWMQEQVVLSALTLPRQPGEDDTAFARRVVTDSQSPRDRAAQFGTAFHRGAERVARTLEVDPAHPAAEWLRLYREWFQEYCVKVHWTERVLVNAALGYAGTADLLIEHREHGLTLVDLKTPGVRRASGPSTYRSWGYQLAAYRQALGEPVQCLNLIVNSLEPHPPVEAPWSEEHMAECWTAFQAARQLWMIEKQFDPTAAANLAVGKAPSARVAPPPGNAPSAQLKEAAVEPRPGKAPAGQLKEAA